MEINTSELAEFLEVTRKKDLATWERQRNSWELDSFVSRRLAALDGVQSEELELIEFSIYKKFPVVLTRKDNFW